MDVQRFAESVRRHVHTSTRTVEVSFLETASEELPAPDRPNLDTAEDEAAEPDETGAPSVNPERDRRKAEDEQPKELDAETSEGAKVADKPKETEPKAEPEPVPEPFTPPELPQMVPRNRIAVVQHVEDADQPDNPNAEFIGDTANTVAEQTQARITATDQNDPEPNPGTAQQGPSEEAGNAATTDIAHSEDSPGVIDRAPNAQAAGERVESSVEHRAGGQSQTVTEVAPNSRRGGESTAEHGARTAANQRPAAEREARLGSTAAHESPDLRTSPAGAERTGDPSEARESALAQRERRRLPPLRRGKPDALDFLGLGASGQTAGGINLNLSAGSAIAAVGHDQLGRERALDGERRRSHHRGSWRTPGIEKWRASIENYNSSVKPGNQTALNTARVPFAAYLNQIHNRLHPVFADSFLASLDGLPGGHPLNKPDMRTNLEIVLDRDEGKIVKMGITRSSGSTVFDVAALESVQNAAPFGKPPGVIVSPDGNVYLHWEFYRNPFYACSTYFARPFMLKPTQESAPPRIAPPTAPTFGPLEQPMPDRGDVGFDVPAFGRHKLGLAR
jgi:TonB family protein